MTLPTVGGLYRLKDDICLLKESSMFSKLLLDGKFFGKGTIVLFCEMSPIVQKIASPTDRTRDDRYRFMKLIVDDLIGWCPFWVASTITSDGHWEIIEPVNNQEPTSD